MQADWKYFAEKIFEGQEPVEMGKVLWVSDVQILAYLSPQHVPIGKGKSSLISGDPSNLVDKARHLVNKV